MIPRYLTDTELDNLPIIDKDVLVIGAGIAGLFTAIEASKQHSVLIIAKKSIMDSNTRFAQGGIAAAIAEGDSPTYHMQDTLIAGAGLCSEQAVDALVNEGPQGISDLVEMGTRFDVENGNYALTKEGAHSQRRILHANGDATGYEIVRALSTTAKATADIELWEHHFVIDLVTVNNECYGAIVQREDGSKVLVRSHATILCSGGVGQLYRSTTNPLVATGDGMAMAYRAGAEIQDVEFIQFHPTALCYPNAPSFLISEAVRGEGAILRNVRGERFMEQYHELKELAPRDIVARAIFSEMEQAESAFVYLDITHEPVDKIKHRFPTIYEYCLSYGLDLTKDLIPVAPAMHYMMGGVKTDLNGETTVNRLFACGEVSSTGVHGANRLASNSLSEAIVFGNRIVKRIAELPPAAQTPSSLLFLNKKQAFVGSVAEQRAKLQQIMERYVGVKRNKEGLELALNELQKQLSIFQYYLSNDEQYEYANLLICAWLAAQSALLREESRGAHYREDYPNRDDEHWQKHTILQAVHE